MLYFRGQTLGTGLINAHSVTCVWFIEQLFYRKFISK